MLNSTTPSPSCLTQTVYPTWPALGTRPTTSMPPCTSRTRFRTLSNLPMITKHFLAACWRNGKVSKRLRSFAMRVGDLWAMTVSIANIVSSCSKWMSSLGDDVLMVPARNPRFCNTRMIALVYWFLYGSASVESSHTILSFRLVQAPTSSNNTQVGQCSQ